VIRVKRPSIAARAGSVLAAATVAIVLVSLAGCGESAQAKASKQLCALRGDISKQIRTLTGLTLSSSSAAAAKASFEAIGNDVNQIKALQPKLDSSHRHAAETATHDFVTRVGAIATALGSKLSPSNAATQFKSALSQLAEAYNQTLASLSC
jgi:hypothetical protein